MIGPQHLASPIGRLDGVARGTVLVSDGESSESLKKTLENGGKQWKMVENSGKWWKTVENGGKQWKMVENDGKRGKMMEKGGK